MSSILIIFIPLVFIIVFYIITLAIEKGIIAVGTCECGGKYRYFMHDTKWGKDVYLCDKCSKKII